MAKKQRNYRKPKYRNKKVTVDGITFDSKAEASYYKQLLILQKSGEVHSFEMQKKYTLIDKFKHPTTGKTVRSISYIPDFVVRYADGTQKVIDVKGFETKTFKLKAKMFMARYQIPLILAKVSKNGRFSHKEF